MTVSLGDGKILRKSLASLIEGVTGCAERLEAASKSSASARAVVDEATADVEHFGALDSNIANDRAADIAASIRAGEAPTFSTVPALAENSAALADANNRLRAARAAVAILTGEEHEARGRLDAAKVGFRQWIKQILAFEADKIAERIEELEDQANALRAQLGGEVGFVAQLPANGAGASISPRLIRILAKTDFTVNSPEWRLMQTSSAAWTRLASALETDAEAQLEWSKDLPPSSANARSSRDAREVSESSA